MEHFKIDIFSPYISLYYNKDDKHSSIPSIIISFIAIIFTIIITLYSFIQTIQRKNFSTYFYDSYIKDPEDISLNKKGLFHFLAVNFINPDDKILTIIGYESFPEYYTNQIIYPNYQFLEYKYIYGKCMTEDMKGLENILEDKTRFLDYGYCIKKAIRIKDKKIINVNDNDFVWPKITRENIDSTPYSIYISKCTTDPDPLTGEIKECENENIIKEKFKNLTSTSLYFIDNYIDVGKFKNPIIPYFYPVDCQADLKLSTYSMSHINFNLAVVNSHESYFIDKVKKTYASVYQRADVQTINKELKTSNILSSYVFWEKDRLQVYERIYDGVFELLSDVGGIYQIIMGVLSFINIFFQSMQNIKMPNYYTKNI